MSVNIIDYKYRVKFLNFFHGVARKLEYSGHIFLIMHWYDTFHAFLVHISRVNLEKHGSNVNTVR